MAFRDSLVDARALTPVAGLDTGVCVRAESTLRDLPLMSGDSDLSATPFCQTSAPLSARQQHVFLNAQTIIA